MAVLFNIDHETGDLTQYDATVTDGGDLSVAAGAALASSAFGLNCFIDDANAIYGQKNQTAPVSNEIRYRFYIDTNNLTMANADQFVICDLRSSGPQVLIVRTLLHYSAVDGYQIQARAYSDAGLISTTTVDIADAEHYTEVHAERASSGVASDGRVRWWVDGVLKETWAAVDNWDIFGNMTFFRLGAVTALDAGTSDTFYLDEFTANDDGGEIGEVAGSTGAFYLDSLVGLALTVDPGPGPGPGPGPFIPPVVFTSAHQSRVLSLMVHDPLWSSSFLENLGGKYDRLQVVKTAFGGYWSLTFSLTDRQSRIEDWIERGIGRHIELYNPALDLIWDGFVNQTRANVGGLSIARGPFLNIANKLKTVYSTVDTSLNPPAVGVRTSTTFAEDADSQATYDVRERAFSVGGASLASAEQIRDVALDELRNPETNETDNLAGGSRSSVTVECLGYMHFLSTYTYANTGTGDVNVSTKIQDIITADPNSTLSTDFTGIETNTSQIGQRESDDRVAMSIVKGLVALGNVSNNRYTFGFYKDRKAQYAEVPTDITYQRSLLEPGQQVKDYNTGIRVLPWDVLPGKWVFYTDLLVGKSQPIITQPSELRPDPRFLFIERVIYTAPWGLTLQGAKVGQLSQLLARKGLGGASG